MVIKRMHSTTSMKPISIRTQILIWLVLYAFWLVFSLDYHPTLLIDIIVTTILSAAYASAIYLNHLVLIPRLFHSRHYLGYFSLLIAAMAVLTFVAFSSVRATYFSLWDPDQIGDYWWHYSIDLFGMIVYVSAAAQLVWIVTPAKLRNRINATHAL
jgi:hypothetical protein